ncbi:PTS sugar transporter subunit IIA [Streptococcus danieliae]|uniref:PTS fructose transporter subunit IIA n=1 Tax=Streptococcus danieliae TaxID=747656 RepID=A0A7Z0M7W0_9STRE|nr:PTS fructose transporter subunit IIA [Streptococcus danieliae]MBF0700185.1 PTS fructose transporter subunit IIA [Streptococcus danieliae]NYS97361.1 PTS fructose transporter subunit IIA [Streptococcus danieliae]
MKYLILVSHGGLAEGVKSSLNMFASDKMGEVLALALQDGESVDNFARRVRQELEIVGAADSTLVLGDLVGGSPLTTVCKVLEERGQLQTALVLGGLNLTMGLTGLVLKDSLEGKNLAQAILTEAAAALKEFEVTVLDEDEDLI